MTFALHLAVKPPIFASEWRAWASSAPLPLHQHPVAELHPALWCPYCAFDQLGAAVRAETVKVYRCVNMNASKIKKKHVYVYMYIKMDIVARISGYYHIWLYITIKIFIILYSFACRFSLSENWYSWLKLSVTKVLHCPKNPQKMWLQLKRESSLLVSMPPEGVYKSLTESSLRLWTPPI